MMMKTLKLRFTKKMTEISCFFRTGHAYRPYGIYESHHIIDCREVVERRYESHCSFCNKVKKHPQLRHH